MSDEFPADNFGVYAPGLRVTKLGPDGEQLFSVEQGKITFHKSGVYEIGTPATVRWLADELDQDDRDFLIGASAAPSELARVLTEVCRALPWNVRAQEELVGEVVAALPEYFPDGVLTIPGDHLRVVVPDGPDEDAPPPEIQRAAHLGIARSWVLGGTLSLDELIGSLKGVEEDKAPLGRPTAPHVVTSDGQRRTDEQDWMVASGVTTMVARQDGLLPEVYVTHEAGENLPVRVLREAGPNGQVATSVMLFQNSGTPSVDTLQGINQALQANSEKLVRELGKAQGDLRTEREISAELRTRLDRALGNLAVVNTTADDRQRVINTLRGELGRANERLQLADEMVQRREETINRYGSLLNAVGKVVHEQANRVTQAARAIGDGADFYVLCDVAVQLRQAAINQCGVPYDEIAEAVDQNADVPWGLRQWALLARQTMEQQALQLGEIKSGHGVTWGMVDRTVAHANKMLREVVAEYPEDLDAAQAEQATRNADSEAVRRLAHAMVEAANELETEQAVISRGTPHAVRMERLASKLRDTVNVWTTEEQRRPWAAAMSGGQGATAGPINEEAQGDHPAWWVAHAGCRHSVDSHRTQRDGGGCRATDCDCKASTDGLRHQHDLMEASESQAPGGDAGADWAPGVVFREVLGALHQAEWLTRHLRGSVPPDYVGPNNELNRLVRGLLGLSD